MSREQRVEELVGALSRYSSIRDSLSNAKVQTQRGMVETGAFRCMFRLADHPARSGELAEALHADPSTISRHVAHLVELGYVRREADPRDGRATILVLTDDGSAKVRSIRAGRLDWLSEILADWTDDDVQTLTDLMTRFTESAERGVAHLREHAESTTGMTTPATENAK